VCSCGSFHDSFERSYLYQEGEGKLSKLPNARLPQERVRGGVDSRDVLKKMGLRVDDGTPTQSVRALDLLQEELSGFRWQMKNSVKRPGHRVPDFTGYPTVKGDRPSLADLARHVRGENHLRFDIFDKRTQRRVQPLCTMGRLGEDFAKLLVSMGVSLPPDAVMHAVADWLRRAHQGEGSTIFSGVCPDYMVGPDGRYTFDDLGSGVGLVASRVRRSLPILAAWFVEHQLDVRFVVAIGDFEARSDETCDRVGLSRDEFYARLRQSQVAFADDLNLSGLELTTPFATEIGDWDGIFSSCQDVVASGQMTGAFKLNDGDWKQVCKARASLYERWYGHGCDVDGILRRQIPEYGTMGTLAERAFPNTLMLGGDSPVMASFWQMLGKSIRPVVYLRGVDY